MKSDKQKVVSIDLWNTLIRVSSINAGFLTRLLSANSNLELQTVKRIIKLTGNYFDELSIHNGHEISSEHKLTCLIENTNANISVHQVETEIMNDLLLHPPELVEPIALRRLDLTLAYMAGGLIITSNSGFVSASIMRSVIANIGITSLKSFKAAFFSEEIGFAKPSREFLDAVYSAGYNIQVHCGDHPIADYGLAKHGVVTMLYDPNDEQPPDYYSKVKSLIELSTALT